MHPRNRYRENKPDFRDLAQHRPSLLPYLIQKKKQPQATPYSHTLDFSNPDALRELACAVLSKDFGLDVVLPGDRLVPMVPQRLNYIHWLEDLLQDEREGEVEGEVEGEKEGEEGRGQRKQVFGIDIGTGASCIYPLLGTALNNWHFLATEIDEVAVQSAKDNVSRNNLQDKISVVKVDPSTALVGAIGENQHYDFVMCNPPFYEDKKERYEGVQRTVQRLPPTTYSTGSEGETITGGGEMGFVKRILQDSLILRTRIQWYTSMLGKKASVKTISQELNQHQVPVVLTTRFVQGKTHRWAVAWSFDQTLAHKIHTSSVTHTRKGSSSEAWSRKHSQSLAVRVPYTEEEIPGDALERITSLLNTSFTQLEIQVREVEGEGGSERQLVCEAHKNTWSQQRKRRRLRQRLLAQTKSSDPDTTGGDWVKAGDLKPTSSVVGSSDTVTTHSSPVQISSESKERSQLSAVRGCHVESAGSEEQDILRQIEALNSPCHIQFSCTACVSPSSTPQHSGGGPSPPKKVKLAERQESTARSVLISFDWIDGDNRDLLHQIVQYLKNTHFQC